MPAPLLLLNPASAAGITGRCQHEIVRATQARLGPCDLVVTCRPGDATGLAREAVQRGVPRLLVAGGDGTNSEVVSGILGVDVPESERPTLGFLPFGSGWDFARSTGLPRRFEDALEVIAAGETRAIDAGRVEFYEKGARSRTRYFVNEASAGLSGETVRHVGNFAKRVGPGLGFALGAVAAIMRHRPVEAAVEVDGERIYEGPISLVVAANGEYFGAGMRVAPNARVDDGLLELVIVRGVSMPRLLVNLPSIYAGRHGRHPSVSFHAAKTLAVLPKAGSAPIDLDGEAVGGLPMRAEVLPGALRIFAPARQAQS